MKDKSKILTVINTGKRKVESEQTSDQQIIRGRAGNGSPGGAYLLKSIWDKCWEIRTTDKGEEYIFGKLPVALQYGLTSYVDGKMLDLPSIYDGLVIDNQTIYWEEIKEEAGTDEEGNPIYKTTKVLKAKGGDGENSGGGGVGSVMWSDIDGKPSWLTDDKISYSEISGTPNLSEYFKNGSSSLTGNPWKIGVMDYGNPYFSFDNGLKWIISLNNTLDDSSTRMQVGRFGSAMEIDKSGNLEIMGGCVVNGNVLVKGGITSYSTSGKATPFLIDVTEFDKITSNSTTQVYTANAVSLLKKQLDIVDTKANDSDTRISNLKNALEDLSASNLSDLVNTLKALSF